MHRDDRVQRRVTLLKPNIASTSMMTTGLTFKPEELVFSAVRGARSAPRTLSLSNLSARDVTIARLDVSTPDFTIDPPLHAAIRLRPRQSVEIAVRFTPHTSHVGPLTSVLTATQVQSGRPAQARLSGLSVSGWEGKNEPPLQAIADTMGYAVDVGGARLEISDQAALIGQEVGAQLFRKAGAGPVTLVPVARYSPPGAMTFGYYQPAVGNTVSYVSLGRLSGAVCQHQTLLPSIESGEDGFDPGAEVFGVYMQYGRQYIHSQDWLNAGRPIPHSLRAYPLKRRDGRTIEHALLLGFEEAGNGDYQDVVFVLSNVEPVSTPKISTPH